jgi:hypothetical protein
VAEFFLELLLFQTKIVEKIEIHILCQGTFFSKYQIMWETKPRTTPQKNSRLEFGREQFTRPKTLNGGVHDGDDDDDDDDDDELFCRKSCRL